MAFDNLFTLLWHFSVPNRETVIETAPEAGEDWRKEKRMRCLLLQDCSPWLNKTIPCVHQTKFQHVVKHNTFVSLHTVPVIISVHHSSFFCLSAWCPLSENHTENQRTPTWKKVNESPLSEDKSQWPLVLHHKLISYNSTSFWDPSPPFLFIPAHLFFYLSPPVPLCGPAGHWPNPKPRSKSPCQLAFGNWKEQTCQNVGKCKTGLKRRTPSLHIRHLGPKSSWHWAGSMRTPPEFVRRPPPLLQFCHTAKSV